MTRNFLDIIATTIAFVLPLYLWRHYYTYSDYAILTVFPLATMLGFATWKHSIVIYRARLFNELRRDSHLATILKGHVAAAFKTAIILLIALPVLVWQTLTLEYPEIIALIVLCVFSSWIFICLQVFIASRHFYKPFNSARCVNPATWIAAILGVSVLSYINLKYVSYPGEILTAGLVESVFIILQENLPERRGVIAEFLAPIYALDAMKLWGYVQMSKIGFSTWASILYCIDCALVSIVVVRTSIILTLLAQILRDGSTRAVIKPVRNQINEQ